MKVVSLRALSREVPVEPVLVKRDGQIVGIFYPEAAEERLQAFQTIARIREQLEGPSIVPMAEYVRPSLWERFLRWLEG